MNTLEAATKKYYELRAGGCNHREAMLGAGYGMSISAWNEFTRAMGW
jgi:hypothetical protein